MSLLESMISVRSNTWVGPLRSFPHPWYVKGADPQPPIGVSVKGGAIKIDLQLLTFHGGEGVGGGAAQPPGVRPGGREQGGGRHAVSRLTPALLRRRLSAEQVERGGAVIQEHACD